MPWSYPSKELADSIWSRCKNPWLMQLHLAMVVLRLAGFILRAEWRTVPVLLLHGVSFAMCQLPPNTNRRRLACGAAVAAWFVRIYVYAQWAGGHQPSIAPTVVRAWHNVWARCLSLFSQQLSAAAEQTPALLLLPSPVVAAILAVQLRIMYAVWLSVNINTSLAYVSLWAAMSFLAPHLLLYYMRRLVEADKAGHKPKEELPTQQLQGRLHKPGKDSGITQEGQSSEDITEASKVVASGSAGGSSAPTAVRSHISAHPPPPPLAPASLTQPSQLPSRPATLQSLRNALRLLQQASSGSRRYTSRLAPLQVRAVLKLFASEPEHLAPDIIAATNRALQGSGVHCGLVVSHATVRIGCTLLTFTLLAPGPGVPSRRQVAPGSRSRTPSHACGLTTASTTTTTASLMSPSSSRSSSPGASARATIRLVPTSCCDGSTSTPTSLSSPPAGLGGNTTGMHPQQEAKATDAASIASDASSSSLIDGGLDAEVVQGWLGALLSAGSRPCDGAVARVIVGDQHWRATWQQATGIWAVTAEVSGAQSSAPTHVDLMSALHPVALLQQGRQQGTSSHRMSLLLRGDSSLRGWSFLSSDDSSAPPSASEVNTATSQVHCIARGPWGKYLPVQVVSCEVAEEPEEGQQGEVDRGVTSPGLSGTYILLTLDVDLATAPGPGAVQLELWAGLNILASAPLLLLPPSPSPASDQEADPLLEELKQHVAQQSWVVAPDSGNDIHQAGASLLEPSGLSALLTDLGHILHTLDCITAYNKAHVSAKGKGTSDAARQSGETSRSAGGPGSWGGIASNTVRVHATDTTLLCSTLLLAEGVLEYAQAEGLGHTVALLQAALPTLSAHIKACQHAPSATQGEAALSVDARQEALKGSDNVLSSDMWAQSQQHQAPSWHACAAAVVAGFQGELEGEYAGWVCQLCSRVMGLWRTSYLVWLAVWTAQRLRAGDTRVLPDLQVPLLCYLPNLVGLVLSVRRRYRAQELIVVWQAGMRCLACCLCAAGLLAYPASYTWGVKLRLDLAWEVLIQAPSEPLRLSSLAVTNALLLGATAARRHLPGLSQDPAGGQAGYAWLLSALAHRAVVVAVGLALDLRRRRAFLQERLRRGAHISPVYCQ